MRSEIAIYPGSFDPPTFGHLNIVERGLKIFKKVIIAVATNTSKKTIFTPEERVLLLKDLFAESPNVEVDQFNGLLVNYVRDKKAHVVLRGLRTVADYEYELQMSFANKNLYPEMETLFMMTESRFSHLSSTIIKEIVHFGGSAKGLVDPIVEKKIKEKLNQNP